MKCGIAGAEAISVVPALRRWYWVGIPAVMALAALAGCPGEETRDEILGGGGHWSLLLSEDGEGGVPPGNDTSWVWIFTPGKGTVWCSGFPSSELSSVMPYVWQDGELVIDSPVTIFHFRDRVNRESEFDSLRAGDVFGHMTVSLRLTGRLGEGTRPYTMAGSYTFTLNEEWGGETFTGTFEGQRISVTKAR